MKIDMKEIGGRIKKIRTEKDLTQEAFGRLIGVQGAAISKYEKGDQDPGAVGLAKIADLGGESLDWLITGKEPEVPARAPTREEALLEIAKAAYQGDKAIALSICEAAGLYTQKEGLDAVESKLVKAYRNASGEAKDEVPHLVEAYLCVSEELRKAAMDMLMGSARRSRKEDGGGPDLAEQNSA